MTTFKDLGLKPEIQKALDSLGFEKPTPIQEQAVPFVIGSEQDVVALAQTGTGKTAAFSLPIIHNLDPDQRGVQAIVLSPTRELANQITRDIESYIKFMPNVKVTAIFGGADISRQMQTLRRGVQIVVATPGRAVDLLKRRALDISKIKWCVLDEADEMLNMGFQDELNAILEHAPEQRQTLLFSATMSREVERISKNYMSDAHVIKMGTENKSASTVEHVFYMAHARDRYQVLKRLADINGNMYGIVFCRTRMETKEVADKLMADGYNADALHGDLSQNQREYVMNRFRKKQLQMLVATDVAARGIDVDDLTHVINYNLPDDLETYIHRSGRTGRAGKTGVSAVLIHMREQRRLQMVERKIGKKFSKGTIPNGAEICKARLGRLVDEVKAVKVDLSAVSSMMPEIYEKFESMDKQEIIDHFVSMEFNQFLAYYKNAPDLNTNERHNGRQDRGERGGLRGDRNDRGPRGSNDDHMMRFYINVGRKDGVNPPKLMQFLNKNCQFKGMEIGKIMVRDTGTFFMIDKKAKEDILGKLPGREYEGRPVAVQVSDNQFGGSRDKPRGGGYRGGGRSGGGRYGGRGPSRGGSPRPGRGGRPGRGSDSHNR